MIYKYLKMLENTENVILGGWKDGLTRYEQFDESVNIAHVWRI